LFYLVALDETDYLMLVPELPAQSLVSALSRFVFRSKVTLSHDNNHHVCGQLLGSDGATRPGLDQTGPQTGVRIVLCNEEYRRVITVEAAPAAVNADALNRWHVVDMMSGWPWIGESQQGHWTPHMLSLQALNAFSVKKGCYPGQEIVARTHFLGKNKRKLYFIQGLDLTEGMPILSAGTEIGKVVNAEFSKTAGLAVLPAEHLPADLHNGAGSIRVENPEIC